MQYQLDSFPINHNTQPITANTISAVEHPVPPFELLFLPPPDSLPEEFILKA